MLRAIDADVVALQEVVGAGPRGGGHAEEIGAALGMGWVMAPARQLRGHQFGNAVLSRFPITQHLEHDLSWKTCEPRRLQRVDVAVDGCTLHVYNVHLGTAHPRAAPSGRAGSRRSCRDRHVGGPKLVLGDFNEWMRGLATTLLSERLNSVDLRDYLRRRRTYPGVFPLLHLDHIYYAGRVEIVGVELRADAAVARRLRSPAARRATSGSDSREVALIRGVATSSLHTAMSGGSMSSASSSASGTASMMLGSERVARFAFAARASS